MINIIAQFATEISPYAQYGIAGALVGWICLRVEKRLDRLDHTLRGLSMALLMDLASRKVLGRTAQKLVHEQLKKFGVNAEDI